MSMYKSLGEIFTLVEAELIKQGATVTEYTDCDSNLYNVNKDGRDALISEGFLASNRELFTGDSIEIEKFCSNFIKHLDPGVQALIDAENHYDGTIESEFA